jgi:hypothetical protein
MSIGITGGGHFYAPFTACGIWNQLVVTDLIPNWGPWAEIIASTPFKARWLDLRCWHSQSGQYYVQIGLGAAECEAVWLPSYSAGYSIPGFSFDVASGVVWGCDVRPMVYSMPIVLPAGSRVVLRVSGDAAGMVVLPFLTLWG